MNTIPAIGQPGSKVREIQENPLAALERIEWLEKALRRWMDSIVVRNAVERQCRRNSDCQCIYCESKEALG